MNRVFVAVGFVLVMVGFNSGALRADVLLDGGFEQQAVLQSNPYSQQSDGSKWGAGWNNWGWSSWQYNFAPSAAWTGGAIARTEEFATGWKWAHTGDVFGIIKDRQTMSQTFLATTSGIGNLEWWDANRSAWREQTWFGRENNYSVTIADNLGNVQLIGNYTSKVYNGLEANSWSNLGDGRFDLVGKQGWFAKSGSPFSVVAGRTYTLSFNSLSPYIYNSSGVVVGVDDRSTLLDDVKLNVSAVPEPGSLSLLSVGCLSCVFFRRRRAA